jgi:UDP-GlcNAc3NAcA epimerase
VRVLSVVGARPQFIKAAALSREIRELDEEILVHTGQHYDFEMSQAFFDTLDIPKPDYNLEVGSGTPCQQVGNVIMKLDKVLAETKPDIVLTYGDTNSTLGGALAAVKAGFPTAHVEAGLRSFNREMPEEVNRVVTDHVSEVLFAPTSTSVDNLAKEGITKNVFMVGDVMVDALIAGSKVALQRSKIVESLNLTEKDYLVATIHRASNTDKPENLGRIVGAMISSGEKIVFPVHPRTEKMLTEFHLIDRLKGATNVVITKPLDYIDFMRLMIGAKKVLTDSGGIQKEAYVLKIPCITAREDTEWVETLEDGWNILVGTDEKKIVDAIANFDPSGIQKSSFGDGKAAIKIARILHEGLKEMLANGSMSKLGE